LRLKKKSVGEYLALLTAKYDLEPEEFVSALRQVEPGISIDGGKFSIECRGRIEKRRIFLVRIKSGILAQIRVPDEFLDAEDSIGKFMNNSMLRRLLAKKRKTGDLCLIRDVRSGMTHINLKAKVLSVATKKHVMTRYGNYADVAKARIADETGAINLLLWNDQINAVSVGGAIRICNARASVFKGERQLSVRTKGVLAGAEGFRLDAAKCEPVSLET
jgi:hypothetical protein